MYFDTPRDYITESTTHSSRRSAARWDIIGRKETVRAATRTRPRLYSTVVQALRMVVGVAGLIDGDLQEEIERLLATSDWHTGRRPMPAIQGIRPASVKDIHTKDVRPRRTLPPASRAIRSSIPIAMRVPEKLMHRITHSHGSSRLIHESDAAPGCVLTSTRSPLITTTGCSSHRRCRIERIDEASTIVASCADRRRAVPSDELREGRHVAKGRFVLQTESPQG